jgi:hypothetical protein
LDTENNQHAPDTPRDHAFATFRVLLSAIRNVSLRNVGGNTLHISSNSDKTAARHNLRILCDAHVTTKS